MAYVAIIFPGKGLGMGKIKINAPRPQATGQHLGGNNQQISSDNGSRATEVAVASLGVESYDKPGSTSKPLSKSPCPTSRTTAGGKTVHATRHGDRHDDAVGIAAACGDWYPQTRSARAG